mmetsp:Transcript_4613/g.6660  ORF Transcript_4613/g.6660 Transcript_4613/m.6660 type:complete len:991 (+) Transcript_4613:232-3204(+)|eukprot:CAMPEP_0194213166 /NCGR_PEP_ID=MMETSP0156-20130528/13553_1 /TAXON_ID=33649 /ORGANISM="Thalassionema nitzschioides, Strain L26-B" /LENGTH=990 /DNA_ID=CAMNT_0038941137 /DNA_START=147 /DNA_END=3119 /DNA_ORIENTATION=+
MMNIIKKGDRTVKKQPLCSMTTSQIAFFTFGVLSLFSSGWKTLALSSSSSFLGRLVVCPSIPPNSKHINVISDDAKWFMRKQKANNKRTRRLQQEGNTAAVEVASTLTKSPMAGAVWSQKTITEQQRQHHNGKKELSGGRSRSRKRSNYYSSVFSYHNHFLQLLTAEYKAEEDMVLSRLRNSVDDPLALESAGHALLDMRLERRGNLFSDEVYRFTKAPDSSYTTEVERNLLPLSCQMAKNDVIMVTHQPKGTGDFFGPDRLPIDDDITKIEGRVLNRGPTYVDVAFSGGAIAATFGISEEEQRKTSKLRVRLDRFFSSIPYARMVSSLSQLTNVGSSETALEKDLQDEEALFAKIVMDPLLRDTILYSFNLNNYEEDTRINELAKRCSKPPLHNSAQMANQVLQYMTRNPHRLFPVYNQPQLNAIAAALTRRLTLLQGPPGTGKTTVGASIAFGFVHQCRNIASENTKVLACAFSNVGADNLAERLVSFGLKVVRIGKASTAISPSLWNSTLDAAIDADPVVRRALEKAATATAQLKRSTESGMLSDASKRAAATAAVKASIQACNVAATKAFREADVIVSTCSGAADPRLLAACGVYNEEDDEAEETKQLSRQGYRQFAPDGKAPMSLPFVIVDEACQSVEPATLIPLVATNSCRSLVLLGDPCQLPPTVLASKYGQSNPLSVSLMERLSTCLPQPGLLRATNHDSSINTEKDLSHLNAKPTQQALSLFRLRQQKQGNSIFNDSSSIIYRKRFPGAMLLSVQYRMHPSIAAFSSAIFYDSMLSTPIFLKDYRRFRFPAALSGDNNAPLDWNVRFVHVGGRCNECQGSNQFAATSIIEKDKSYSNQLEADQVLQIVKQLLEKDSGRLQRDAPFSIGIVTPYKAQVKLIQGLLKVQKLDHTVEVNSVDGYQGRERDIIIASMVRSNRRGSIGFLKDWRRLNVAWTRAKYGLIMVGDSDTLSQSENPYWNAVVKFCEATNSMVKAADDDQQ